MHGIYFVTNLIFLAVLLLATGAALYMGVFKANRDGVPMASKFFRGVLSALISGVTWFGLYSWSYLSW